LRRETAGFSPSRIIKANEGNLMKISQGILYEKLLRKFTFGVFGAENSDLSLEWPMFLRDYKNLKDDQIYLSEDGMIDGKPARKIHSILLYIGIAAEDFVPFFDAVFVFRNISLFDLYDAVQEIYSEYEKWDGELRDILTSGGGIQEMINQSTRIFDNPIVLYDKQFSTVIYNTGAGEDSASAFLLDRESLADLAGASSYGESSSRQIAVFASPHHTGGLRSIYTNILSQGKTQYRLMVLEFFRKFTPSDGALLEHLANTIQIAASGPAGEEENVTTLALLLRNILIGGHAEAHILDQRMNEYNWQKDQKLIWVRVPGTAAGIESEAALPAHTLCARIREIVPDSCAFEYSGGAAVLINLEYFGKDRRTVPAPLKSGAAPRKRALLGKPESAASLDRKSGWERKNFGNKMIMLADVLDAFLEQQELKAGFSDVFSGTSAIREHYKQSEFALSLGMRRNPQGRVFYFGDVKEFLLLDNCLRELPATMVCAPEILSLRNYDLKHNTIYYETFYSYLRNNLSPVQTIKELNIHRSTLIYRLEKIRKIAGLDTANCDNQWYLLLSYKLLEHAGRYGGI
jgi:hypothetical protein